MARSPLSHGQAEGIAADLAAKWPTLVGEGPVPGEFALTDLVQFVLRRGAEVAEEASGE